MKIVNKDITAITEGVIIHQVNCKLAMGSGVAKAIIKKHPQVYNDYIKFSRAILESNVWYADSKPSKSPLLGQINPVEINDDLTIINLFGQKHYGREKKRYTSYGAWEEALPNIKEYAQDRQVYFPYLCGCALGGGDWRVISAMIEEYFPDAIFCKI